MIPYHTRPDRTVISRYLQDVLKHIDELLDDHPFLIDFEPTVLTIADVVRNISGFTRSDIHQIKKHLLDKLAVIGEDADVLTRLIERSFIDIIQKAPEGILSSQDILMSDEPPLPSIIQDILTVGLSCLAGRPKTGKSHLTLQIARAVSHGEPIFGKSVVKAPVLYLACEDPKSRIKTRMKMQQWKTDDHKCDFMTLKSFREEIGELDAQGSEILANIISERGCKLVVIDTLSRVFSNDQNDAREMTRALAPLQKVAYELGVAILLVDHHHKSLSANRDPVFDILGSTAKGAVINTVLALYREPGKGYAELKILGHDVIENTLQLEMDIETGTWRLAGNGTSTLPESQESIIRVIDGIKQGTLKEICAALGKDWDRDRGTTYKALQELIAKGIVQKNGKGYRKKGPETPPPDLFN